MIEILVSSDYGQPNEPHPNPDTAIAVLYMRTDSMLATWRDVDACRQGTMIDYSIDRLPLA